MEDVEELVEKLREFAKVYGETGFGLYRTDRLLRDAANTVERLVGMLNKINNSCDAIGRQELLNAINREYNWKYASGNINMGQGLRIAMDNHAKEIAALEKIIRDMPKVRVTG